MGKHDHEDDQLDEVLASLERARNEPEWVPPEPRRGPRRLITPPQALERARWVPSQPAVLVLLGCAVLAAAILGVRLFLAHQSEKGSALHAATSSTAHPSVVGHGALTSSGVTNAGSSTSATVWSVHVVGAVKNPGVVAVSPGARVKDAVAAAGGLTPNADSANINLARLLSDGEQIHVPRPGESATVAQSGAGSIQGASGSAAAGGVVNLNTADVSALDSLPGVGPVLAQRILDWRNAHGKFSSVDELGEVSGIGDKALERLRPHVSI